MVFQFLHALALMVESNKITMITQSMLVKTQKRKDLNATLSQSTKNVTLEENL